MKTIVVTVAMMLVWCASAVAQEQTDAEKQREFNEQKLTVEAVGVSVSSDIGYGVSVSESWRRWQAYRGFHRLSEEEFFTIVGYPDLAKEARAYRHSSGDEQIVGSILGIGGVVLVIVGLTSTEPRGFDSDAYAPNYFLIVGGGVISALGVSLILSSKKKSQNFAPYSQVSDLAEQYNKQLRAELQISF